MSRRSLSPLVCGLKNATAWAACVLGVAALAASCKVGDAICTDHTVEEDRNDDCPYGPPGGPQRQRAEGCVVTFDKSDCDVTFRDDVYPILVAPLGSGGGCVTGACHGENGSGKLDLVVAEDASPDELYEALAAHKNEAGNPYIEADNPNAYFLCNVTAAIGGGSAMPPNAGLTDPAMLDVVKKWVACGMELDGTGEGGGGTGGGGAGGAGQGGQGGAGGGA